MASAFVFLQMLHDNEEVLLHVFDGALPGDYQLGVYEHCHRSKGNYLKAVQQAEQLLQVQAPVCPSRSFAIACCVLGMHWLLAHDAGGLQAIPDVMEPPG